MTDCPQQQRPNLVYTPICHIPIGEAIVTENGIRAVRFKKAGGKDVEVVPIDTLISMFVNASEKEQGPQARRSASI